MASRQNLLFTSAMLLAACGGGGMPPTAEVPSSPATAASSSSAATPMPDPASPAPGASDPMPTPLPVPASPAAPPANCGPATPRFYRALCGPSQRCVVGAREIVSDDSAFLGPGTIAISVDAADRPLIMYGTEDADGGFHGHLALRDDAGSHGWSREETPFNLKSVALATSADGVTHALVFDGERTVSHFTHVGSRWSEPDLMANAGQGGSERLHVDDAGCVRAAFPDANAGETLATLNGEAWALSALDGSMSRGGSPTLAVAPSGQPHLVAWVPDEKAGLMLAWTAPPNAPEPIGPRHVSGFIPPRLGVTGIGLGQSHVLFIDPGDGARPARLQYARRTDLGWTVDVVGEDHHDSNCAAHPQVASETCARVDLAHSPIAVLTSGNGDVRLLYSRHEEVQEFTGKCDDQGCYWAPASDASIDALMIGWRTSGGIDRSDLMDGVNISAASAVLDGQGRIHVVATVDHHINYLSIIPVP